jgi:hypothetical protein
MGAVQLSLLHQGSLRSLVRRPTALWDHRQPDRRTLRPSASTAAPGPHATATTIRPQRREDATAARPQRPATGDTADPFPPGCLLQVGRIKTRGPRQARRRRPLAAAPPHMSSPPAARRRPSVAARSGHIPTRARGQTAIPNGAGQRRFVLPQEAGSWWRQHAGQRCQIRGRSYGPQIHAPAHRPDGGRSHESR